MLHSAEVAILTAGCQVGGVGDVGGVGGFVRRFILTGGDRGRDQTSADVFSFWRFVGCQKAEVGVRTKLCSWQSVLFSRARLETTPYTPITLKSS